MRYVLILALALLAACGGDKTQITVAPMSNAVASGASAGTPQSTPATLAGATGVATSGAGTSDGDRSTDVPDLSALDKDDDPKRTIAGLGDPVRAGLWMETPLVTSQRQGRVVVAGSARGAQVTLIPVAGPAGGGSRLSLEAMRVLNVPLTDLVTLDVYRDG